MARGQKALTELGKQLEAKKQRAKVVKPKQERAVVIPIDAFTAQHGDYQREGVKIRNRHVTTVERWTADKLLSESQMRAIQVCEGLWHDAGSQQGLVMDLNKIPGLPGGSGMRQQHALDELAWLKKHFAPPSDVYWHIFEAVCRDDEPGGRAGSRFASDNARASMAALMCVRFVADKIAEWRRL